MHDTADVDSSPSAHRGPGRPGVLDALWDVYPDNLFLIRVEASGRFVVEAVNPALRERFALPDSAIQEKTIEELHGPEVAREIIAHYRDCLLADRPLEYEEPSRSPVAEGEVFETILMPVRSADGHVSHLLGISRAITRLRRAEQALRQSNRELEYRLERRREDIVQLRESLRRRNMRDELTGCYARAVFMEMAARELARIPRDGQARCMLLVALDDMAGICQRFGRSAGDAMVSTIVTLIRESLNDWELLGRCDSGEFIVLLERDRAEAESLAQQFCQQVSQLTPKWQGRPVPLSVSIGLASTASLTRPTADQLGQAASQALEEARVQGPGHWHGECSA